MPSNKLPVPYTKMHGTGNDFVILDLVSDTPPDLESSYLHNEIRSAQLQSEARVALSKFLHQHLFHTPRDWEFPKGVLRRIANRQLGIGCDQVVALIDGGFGHANSAAACRVWYDEHTSELSGMPEEGQLQGGREVAWVAARIFNGVDGTEVGMCANAVRCIALYWLAALLLDHPSLYEMVLGTTGATTDDEGGAKSVDASPVVTVYLPGSRRKLLCGVRLTAASRTSLRGAIQDHLLRTSESMTAVPSSLSMATIATILEDGEAPVVANIGFAVSSPQLVPFSEGIVASPLEFFRGAFRLETAAVVHQLRTAASPFADSIAERLHAAFLVGLGNPHLVLIFESDGSPILTSPSRAISTVVVDDSSNSAESTVLGNACVDSVGPLLCTWTELLPRGANIEFVRLGSSVSAASFSSTSSGQTEGALSTRMRVYERGTGRTLACGSGACAAAVAVSALQAPSAVSSCVSVSVVMDGGEVEVRVFSAGDEHAPFLQITGPATFSATGCWLPTFA